MSVINRRRHPRTPSNEVVRLTWEDRDEHLRVAKGKVINRSQSGLMIETTDAIETRTFVQVQTERRRVVGMACVRHCFRKGLRYVVGLEFAGDARWKDEPAPAGADG
jgi:hypothetical protein